MPEISAPRSMDACDMRQSNHVRPRASTPSRVSGTVDSAWLQVQACGSKPWEDQLMMTITRREALAFGAALSAAGLAGAPALAQQRFFRIGTGGTGGTYYPGGGRIADPISTPTINVSAASPN